jgi:gamma-glutamylcyclotransferase (GGCT)/AIG2-like uncharacterized protein YtfP
MTGQINTVAPAVKRRMISLGRCRIPGRLVRVAGGAPYPAVLPAAGQTTRGELFRVSASDLGALDAYED